MIDLYCERTSAGLLAEPVNALTNLSFFIAAWLAWRLAHKHRKRNPATLTLIGLVVLIGIGSSLFHTFANRTTLWMDELPILVFQLTFLGLYLRRVIHMRWSNVIAYYLAFVVLVVEARQHGEILNGSLAYLPALLVLLALAWLHWRERHKERALLFVASGVFIVSVLFRSIDNAVCADFPLGTHFLWHILNGILMYLLLRVFIVSSSRHRTTRE